jgi:hypothetical protein
MINKKRTGYIHTFDRQELFTSSEWEEEGDGGLCVLDLLLPTVRFSGNIGLTFSLAHFPVLGSTAFFHIFQFGV